MGSTPHSLDHAFCAGPTWKADKDPRKINLGVGAYRDDNGKPYVLNAVKKAEELLVQQNPDKEYLPITGLPEFTQAAAKLAYGEDSIPLKESSIVVAQSIFATGALRIGGAFLARLYPHSKTIYLPTPSWGNHTSVFRDSGLEVKNYRYFDKKTVGLDFEGLKEDLKGFASGSTSRDASAVRNFVSGGHQIALAQSFANSMGLYGERVGLFSLITANPEERARVDSRLKIVIRPMYSKPPLHGARIASTILRNQDLYGLWESEVKHMAGRIIDMRHRLRDNLDNLNTPGDWSHITRQIGMCSGAFALLTFTRFLNWKDGGTERNAGFVFDNFMIHLDKPKRQKTHAEARQKTPQVQRYSRERASAEV
ncbi:PLP-dependent transferase [Trametes sanguinea]|nr:PLP-dependent transferase [Trametes sanguinea]